MFQTLLSALGQQIRNLTRVVVHNNIIAGAAEGMQSAADELKLIAPARVAEPIDLPTITIVDPDELLLSVE